MTSLRWLFTGLLACLLSFAMAGCESLGDDDDDDWDRDDDRVIIGRDVDRDAERIRGIPSGATRVKRGEGEMVSYTPREDGTIYVYDADDNEVIYSGRLDDGERFVLDPVENEATIDDRRVLNTDLKKRHRYHLYFDER